MDILITVVHEYVRDLKKVGRRTEEAFLHYSYSKWAASEILREHELHPEIDPYELVNLLAEKFEHFAEISAHEVSYTFSTAKDTCDYISEMLLDERRKNE